MQSNSDRPFTSIRIGTLNSLLLLVALLLIPGLIATAQSTSAPAATANHSAVPPATVRKAAPQTTPANRPAVHRKARHHTRKKTVLPAEPPPPPPPLPPAEQAAHPATITFQHDSLRIDADNSSLVQTLTQVSHITGISIEGLNRDERIYGQYGPGPVTTTLSKLLDGAGYNYVIVGGGPGESPAKLLLTPTSGSAAAASAPAAVPPADANSPQDDTSAPEDPSEPVHPKTPQEIFNELRRMHPSSQPQ